MDPNIVGGAGGRHKGLIQFGQNEQQKYLNPGTQTRAGQMPAVLQYFQDRGYKPGMAYLNVRMRPFLVVTRMFPPAKPRIPGLVLP
jgi:hypothetical protein